MATAGSGRFYVGRAEPLVNVKRVYPVMRNHDLLLEKRRKQPGVARRDEGLVAVGKSNTCWSSDGFEFRCDDGAKLRVTFALDCCDREAISWVASPSGYSDDVRDVMLEAVEKRFTAEQTRAFARDRLDTADHASVQPAEQRHGGELRET